MMAVAHEVDIAKAVEHDRWQLDVVVIGTSDALPAILGAIMAGRELAVKIVMATLATDDQV